MFHRIGSWLWVRIKTFLSAAPEAVKDHLNVEELCRVVVAAVSAGGGVLTIFQAIATHCGGIFPAPPDAALAAVVVTMILEAVRRLDHGATLAPNVTHCRRLR